MILFAGDCTHCTHLAHILSTPAPLQVSQRLEVTAVEDQNPETFSQQLDLDGDRSERECSLLQISLVCQSLSVVVSDQLVIVGGEELEEPLGGKQVIVLGDLVTVKEIQENFECFVETDKEVRRLPLLDTLVDNIGQTLG